MYDKDRVISHKKLSYKYNLPFISWKNKRFETYETIFKYLMAKTQTNQLGTINKIVLRRKDKTIVNLSCFYKCYLFLNKAFQCQALI